MLKSLANATIGKIGHDLPGICIMLQMLFIIGLAGVLGYVFVTQELLS